MEDYINPNDTEVCNDVKIGSVFALRVGYDCTYYEFYQVVGKTSKKLKVKEIKPEVIKPEHGFYLAVGGYIPVGNDNMATFKIPNSVVENDSKVILTFLYKEDNGGYHIKLNSGSRFYGGYAHLVKDETIRLWVSNNYWGPRETF